MRLRLLLALVATSGLTLVVAAATLLSPLQHRLRDQSRTALQTAALSVRGQLEGTLRDRELSPAVRFTRATRIAQQLGTRTNAVVHLYELRNGLVVPPPAGQPAVYQAFGIPRTVTTQDADGINLAVPLGVTRAPTRRDPPGATAVLGVRKQDTNLTLVVAEVRDAFLVAALVGFAVAVALGLFLSARMSRRLARLRDIATRVVTEGPEAPSPVDRHRDELGDLARAMAAMQAALRRQETARRHFVATASHELRTPLTSLMGTLELLDEDLAGADLDVPDARAQVAAARADLQRLQALATELLDLSRLDAGIGLRAEPVELGELTRAVAAEFLPRVEARARTLRIVPPRGPCWALGDPGALARAVRILLDNALRYTPDDATIELRAEYQGEHAMFVVADDGPGIPAAEQDVVFDRFRRGTDAAAPGFGLGLAIARELIVQLGGTLTLRPDHAPGCRFEARLLIAMPEGGGGQAASDRASRSYAVDGGVM